MRTMHQSTTPSLSQNIWGRWASRQFLSLSIVQIFLPVTFGYSLSSEAVVMRQFRRWKRMWRRSLTCSHKRTSMGPFRSCWNGTTSALRPEDITSYASHIYIYIYIYTLPSLQEQDVTQSLIFKRSLRGLNSKCYCYIAWYMRDPFLRESWQGPSHFCAR